MQLHVNASFAVQPICGAGQERLRQRVQDPRNPLGGECKQVV